MELVQPRFNETAISYRAFEFCVGHETLFRDIYSVEPGNALIVQADGSHQIQAWWRIWDYLLPVPSSPEQAIEDVVYLLEDAIRKRQAEGIAAAKVSGVRFGREPKPLPSDFLPVYELWSKGEISTSEAARHFCMARSTFRYRADIFKKDAL